VKRIWRHATAAPLAAGFGILLDDKPLKKPGGGILAVPVAALAAAIAKEWDTAGLDGRDIKPDDLPLTRLATTATDRIAAQRGTITRQLAGYGLHDLICYRAEILVLAERQAAAWDPWIDWTVATFGVQLNVTTGILPIAQPPDAEAIFTACLAQKTDFEMAGLGVVIPALGSLVLGLAFLHRALDAPSACRLAMLDELFQAERWGEDDEAVQRRAAILEDLVLTEKFWTLTR
jgi:chaperone required for assembly of F1-ATPase